MFTSFKRLAITIALAAGALTTATTAQARDGYRHRDGGDDAAIAIGAGIVGLAIGAAIADNGGRHHRRYRDYDYDYYDGGYYYDSYPRYRDGWRNRRYDNYYRRDYGRYYDRRDYRRSRNWDRRRDRWERRHGW